MPETIVLDPTEVASSRTAFPITPWIGQEGPDWGDGEIQAYMADQSRGATPVDFRVPNRTVQIPLVLRAQGGTAFATARSMFQAKASLFQREGGWLRRITSAGGTVYADVVNATLKLGGGWLQSAKDADLDATLTLECLPDFYEAERTLADHTETSACELVFTEIDVDGDYPARVRVVVDEDQGQSQLGLIWSFRNRHYSSAATAATRFEAEALNPLDTAARAALSGASGGTVVTHGTLSTNWTPVLDLRAGGTAYPTHTGTNRLWVRYRTTSGTAVQLRAVWDVGDMVFPVENVPIRCNAGTSLFMADLGELRLDPSPVGAHRWNAIIQGKGDAGGENVSIDKVEVLNADEGYGILRASVALMDGLSTFTARDSYDQTAGTLTSKVAPVGGTWAGAGDADDFSVEAAGHTVQRTAVSDADINTGRYAVLGSTGTMTSTAVQANIARVSGSPGTVGGVLHDGLLARYVDTSNWVKWVLSRTQVSASEVLYEVKLVKRTTAGGVVTLGSYSFGTTGQILGSNVVGTWFTLRLAVYATGLYFGWFGFASTDSPTLYVSGSDADFVTGGALASGKVGIYDALTVAGTTTRSFDSLIAYAPPSDAVLNPSQSAELRWDGMVREDVSGSAWGPMSQVVGDLPRLPPTVEGRTTEVFIKASRGDFDTLPDTGIDDISARLTYRPCWLTVPGT